jgi:hypothetical protein
MWVSQRGGTQNKTFYFRELSLLHFFLNDWPIKLACCRKQIETWVHGLMPSHDMKDAMMHRVENLTCTMMNDSMHFSTRPMMTFKIIPLVTRMVLCKLNYFICVG